MTNKLKRLTPRELEILTLMAQGYTNEEILSRLFIKKSTLNTHIVQIYSKLTPNTIKQKSAQRVRAVLLYLKATSKLKEN